MQHGLIPIIENESSSKYEKSKTSLDEFRKAIVAESGKGIKKNRIKIIGFIKSDPSSNQGKSAKQERTK